MLFKTCTCQQTNPPRKSEGKRVKTPPPRSLNKKWTHAVPGKPRHTGYPPPQPDLVKTKLLEDFKHRTWPSRQPQQQFGQHV